MQAVRRNMQYATTGVHADLEGMMRVRGGVYLPDADAGRRLDGERQAYIHTGPVPSSKRALMIPGPVALVLLGALILFFVVQIGSRLSIRAGQSKAISGMEREIVATMMENQSLSLEIAECRDSSRICYRAVQELGMVSSAAVEAVPVVAPDTRPYQTQAMTAAGNSPSAAGLISGSR